jgi:hypothetical protein
MKASYNKGNTHALKHGHKNHPVYKAIENIFTRCYNTNSPQYKDYGGRGIQVHSKWIGDRGSMCDYLIAIGYEEGLTIDRIDNDTGYVPGNLRWADRTTQNRNSRACKIDKDTVVKIRTMCDEGIARSAIARNVGLAWSHVDRIVKRESWQDV